MQKEFQLAVDIEKKILTPSFEVNTLDLKTIKLKITITRGMTLVDLTDIDVRMSIRKPDGNVLFQDCQVTNTKGGQVEIILENQAYVMPGSYSAEIMCFKGTDKVAVTGSFSYRSIRGIMDDKAVESKSEFTAITKQLGDVQATVNDLRENGTGIDAQARQEVEQVSAQLADMTYYAKPTGTSDDTPYLQNIFNNYPRIVIKAGTYNINAITRLKPPSNRYIEWEEGAVFQTIPNSTDNYRVIQIQSVENITLVNPVLYGDRTTHTGTAGESGHGIVLYTCKNIKIYNPICNNFWGDGIVVGTGSVDVLIDNAKCDNNRRQGISLIDGKNIFIRNPVLTNTKGIPPQFGLDIEPTFNTAVLENIQIINPVTKNNYGGGINVNLTKMAGSSNVIDILIDNHLDEGSTDGLYFYKNPSGITGNIVCNNGVYRNNTTRGIAFQNCSAENSLEVKIINPSITNPNTSGQVSGKYGSAIALFRETAETETYLLGNATIINPSIRDTRSTPKMARGIGIYDEKSIGYKNVKIIDPLEITGIPQTTLMDLAKGSIKVTDKGQVFVHDFSGINMPMYDRVYTKLMNPSETTNQRVVTLSQTHVSDYPMTIQNMSSFGVKVLPNTTAKILPITTVAGKSITTTQIGASITLRHISSDVWYVENMIGTWTVES